MFKMRDSVSSARYSLVCNVLRQWKTSHISTYRVYRLYDTYIQVHFSLPHSLTPDTLTPSLPHSLTPDTLTPSLPHSLTPDTLTPSLPHSLTPDTLTGGNPGNSCHGMRLSVHAPADPGRPGPSARPHSTYTGQNEGQQRRHSTCLCHGHTRTGRQRREWAGLI